MDKPLKIRPLPERETPKLCPPDFKDDVFRHMPGQQDTVLMFHVPTKTAFEIVCDKDHAKLEGLPFFGFAACISFVCGGGEAPGDPAELTAIGRAAIDAFIAHSMRCPAGHIPDANQPDTQPEQDLDEEDDDEEEEEDCQREQRERREKLEAEALARAYEEYWTTPVKYTCPECGQHVWGGPQATLICGDCYELTDGSVIALMLGDRPR
jgi:hypothetical protein